MVPSEPDLRAAAAGSAAAERRPRVLRHLRGPASPRFAAAVALLLVLAAAAYLPRASRNVDYHPDEGVWTAAGKYYFERFFLEGDFSYETWSSPRYMHFGHWNPTVGKFLFGASLFAQGVVEEGVPVRPYDDFGGMLGWNVIARSRPPAEILAASRRFVVLVGAVSTAVVFLLVRALTRSWATGALAALLQTTSPLWAVITGRALMDTPALLFGLATLLALTWALPRHGGEGRARRPWLGGLVVGAALGAALGTKLNTLLVAAVGVAWAAAWIAWRYAPLLRERGARDADLVGLVREHPAPFRRLVVVGATALFVSGAVFYASNPYLYPRPVGNTLVLLSLNQALRDYPAPPDQRLDSWGERFGSLIHSGERGPLGRATGWPPADVVLAGLGALALVRRTARGRRARLEASWLLLWVGVTAAGVLVATPFNWARFYAPMIPCWAALEAAGLVAVVRAATRVRSSRLKTAGTS